MEHYDLNGDSEYACDGYSCQQDEPSCVDGLEHAWTRRGCGGCDSNPGVWSLGGTAYRYACRCILCGCSREEHRHGWQRNPGECDTVSYVSYAYDVDEHEAATERRRQRRNEQARERRALARERAARAVWRALSGLTTR